MQRYGWSRLGRETRRRSVVGKGQQERASAGQLAQHEFLQCPDAEGSAHGRSYHICIVHIVGWLYGGCNWTRRAGAHEV